MKKNNIVKKNKTFYKLKQRLIFCTQWRLDGSVFVTLKTKHGQLKLEPENS